MLLWCSKVYLCFKNLEIWLESKMPHDNQISSHISPLLAIIIRNLKWAKAKNDSMYNIRWSNKLLSHGAECNMGKIFRTSHILQNIIFLLNRIIYKMRKMLGNIHEAMCDSYFTIKCLLEWNPAGVTLLNYLMHLFCLIQCNTNLIQTSRSKNWKY